MAERWKTSTGYDTPVQREKQDCSVRAYSVAMKVSYEVAHTIFAAMGRKKGKGTPYTVSCFVYEGYQKMPVEFNGRYLTLFGFTQRYPKGRFVVHTSGHALCVVNGLVIDWEFSRAKQGSRVVTAWKISDEGVDTDALLKEGL